MIAMNDFKAFWRRHGDDCQRALSNVGASGWYILGTQVRDFEKDLASQFGVTHAIGVANGLDALEISLRAMKLTEYEKVLTTPLSAFATTLAILRAGCTPVFVDTDERGLIDLDRVEDLLTRDRSIQLFAPVHLYGFALDLDRLEKLKTKFGLKIVEDCAQSIRAEWNGRKCGSVGQFAATSFYPTKNLGCMGDGGAVLTNDPALDAKARSLRDYGQSSKYVHSDLGMNSRLDEVQAAFLKDVMLPQLPAWTKRRAEIASMYNRGLSNDRIELVTPSKKMNPCWHLYSVRASSDRSSLQSHLKLNGVESSIHYPGLIPDQPVMSQVKFDIDGTLDRARQWVSEQLSLPIHPFLSDADVDQVIGAVNSWKS